jgi:hypothetical protein
MRTVVASRLRVRETFNRQGMGMGKGMGGTGFARSARYKAKVAPNEGREAAGPSL